MLKKQTTKKGSVLAFSLLILTVMFLVALSVSVIATQERKDATNTEASTQAYQAADTGAEAAIKLINATILDSTKGPTTKINQIFPDCTSTASTGTFNGANFKLTFFSDNATSSPIADCTNTSINQIKGLKSTGFYLNTVRALSVAVKINCPDPCCGANTFTDVRGAESIIYSIKAIGSGANARCWFTENLRTSQKPDGSGSITRYCNPANGCASPWGGLYDWNTAMNGAAGASSAGAKIQGICPSGWHVPSDYNANSNDDMGLLQTAGNVSAGNDVSLRSTNPSHWSSVTGYTNSTGFSGVGAGYYQTGSYKFYLSSGLFWTSYAVGTSGNYRGLTSFSDFYISRQLDKSLGMSVRCVMD